jgi:nitrogen fixation protein
MKINPEQLAEFIVNSLNSKNLNSGHIYLDNGFELQLVTKEYVVENLNNIDRFIAMKKRAGLSSDIDKRTLEERKMLINQLNAFRRMS